METKGIRNINCFLAMQCHVPVVAENIRPVTPNKISKPFSGPPVKILWCWMFYSYWSFSSSQTSFAVWSTFVPIWGNIQSGQNGWPTESAKVCQTRACCDKVFAYHSSFSTSDIQKELIKTEVGQSPVSFIFLTNSDPDPVNNYDKNSILSEVSTIRQKIFSLTLRPFTDLINELISCVI